MQILHFNIKPIQNNYVELRYFESNPNDYQSRSLPLTEIADLIQLAERDYYIPLPEDYQKTGASLFNWLDGNDRFLQQLLDNQRGKGIVLAISTSGNIAHLPWELLHNGKCFLVETKPGIIPVRWVSSGTAQKISIKAEPENRALQMLFMATSPLSVKPVLDFEKEEASILTATARQPLTLTVEESGCLEELGYLVADYGKEDGKSYFDVLHLTGHATIKDEIPAFITESPTGEAVESTAEDIASELQFQLPKLIFLSGCRTGQAGNSGAVPSMAESLLNAGATAVLGWGEKVLDTDATAAAAALYQALSAGKQLTEALALTYQDLIKNKARDWHLLRLYVGDSLPGNLVTSLRTRGRKPAPPASFSTKFLDVAGKVKVPTRESFVGRRRQLQSCLRTLINPSSEEVGVLIHGMGGLGKSSLAARLCDRLTNFQRVVWVGGIDEASLVNRLTDKLDNQELRETLQNPDEELKFRLKKVFGWLQEAGNNPFLLVLDDFEANLEPRNDSYVLLPVAAKVLSALVWAIKETYASDRIIITCRYDFESTYLQQFYKQPLEGMHGADLRKKLSRLAAFKETSQVDETLQAKAQQLADGNPRLLEWLDKLLQSDGDVAAILDKLEVDSVELREQVLAEELLQQMDHTMREMLQLGLVFELPVPKEALESVCDIADLGKYIDKAIGLGLLEVSPDKSLRVPRILPLKLLGDVDLCKKASQVLYQLWWEEADKAELLWFGNIPHLINYPFSWMKITETTREERMLEISRLALQGKEKIILVNIGSFIARRWNYNNRWQEAANICQEILKLVEDYRIFHNLSISQGHLGNIDKALVNCHKALEFCSPEDEREKASIIHNLATLETLKGNFDEAISLHQKSLKLKQSVGDVGEIATTFSELARIKAEQGEFEEALKLYKYSLSLKNPIVAPKFKALVFNNMANIYTEQRKFDEALTLYEQSFKIGERLENIELKAAVLHGIGRVYDAQDRFDEAINILHKSLELKKSIGDIKGEAATLSTLGQLLAEEKEDFRTGLAYLEESLNIYKKLQSPCVEEIKKIIIGVQQQQGITLHNTAIYKFLEGYFDEAIALYKQSLAITEETGDVQSKANTLGMLGQLLADVKGDFDTGLDYLQQSLEILQRLQGTDVKTIKTIIFKLQKKQAVILYNEAITEVQQNCSEKAFALFYQSLDIAERIGDREGKAMVLAWLGQLMADEKQDFTTALNYLQQSLKILQQLKSPDAEEIREWISEVKLAQLINED